MDLKQDILEFPNFLGDFVDPERNLPEKWGKGLRCLIGQSHHEYPA